MQTKKPVVITELDPIDLARHPEFDKHFRVIRFEDSSSGLLGFIAIHRSRGVLSTGGTRYAEYAKESDALTDALRLSHAMTAKCTVAGLPYGGAKGVIIARGKTTVKSRDLLEAYAEVVNALSGAFRTGEDVGMTESDVQELLRHSHYFNGRSDVAGDPSPFAAKSVAVLMKQMSTTHLGKNIDGLQVAIKGVGKVGGALAEMLVRDGARVAIADIDPTATKRIHDQFDDVKEYTKDEIAFLSCDVYAPCALGDEVSGVTIARLGARMLCGGANNQLAHTKFAKALEDRNILYIPDYLANAGGVINVSDELEDDGYSVARVNTRIQKLGELAKRLYEESRARKNTLFAEVEQYVHDNE